MKLRQIAHSRAGDKGNISNISVIAFDSQNYEFLRHHVTAERVRAHFTEIVRGEVTRHEMPSIGALNFVLTLALGGGVMPVGGVVASARLFAPLNADPLLHSSTFAGSPLAAAPTKEKSRDS